MTGIGQTGKAAFRLCTAVHELNHLCGHKEEFPQGKSTGKPEQKKTRSSLSDGDSFCSRACAGEGAFSACRPGPYYVMIFLRWQACSGILEMDAPPSPIHFCV